MWKRVLRMRFRWIGILASVFLSACGNAPRLSWPAQIPSIEGIDGDSLTLVQDKIADLNARLDSPILNIGSGSGSPIYIKKVESFENVAGFVALGDFHLEHADLAYIQVPGARGTVGAHRIAGRATLSGKECKIELASFLMKPEAKDLLHPVLWHEIGHCGGLSHISREGALMAPLTLPFPKYTEEELTQFFNDFVASIRRT